MKTLAEQGMHFALLGKHPDGIKLAAALISTGRHDLVAYTDDVDRLRALAGNARRIRDVEEILADPSVEAVIVGGTVADCPSRLRRALQSEHHVLCVHLAGDGPEIAYEASMIRDDTGRVLLPILPEGLYPAVSRLAQFIQCGKTEEKDSPLGDFVLLEIERAAPEALLTGITKKGGKVAFPGWDMLRTLGGEIAELSVFAENEEVDTNKPILIAGRFERGGLFQVALLPNQEMASSRLTVIGKRGRAELLFPVGLNGPSFLNWQDVNGEQREEYQESQDPWPSLVEAFESAVAGHSAAISWQDAVRALELDDAARRSLLRRHTSLLEYPEATEEVGFKGTMTLVGCSVLLGILLLAIFSTWFPWLRWAVIPLLAIFLCLQLLWYVLPKRPGGTQNSS